MMNDENATQALEIPDSLFDNSLQSEETPASETTSEPEVQLPEKFKGKDLTEIVKSYEDLEKRFGKQGAELGELRKLTDEFLKRQLTGTGDGNSNHQDDSILDTSDVSLREVDKLIEQKLTPALKELNEYKKEKMTNKLMESHPDFIDIVKDLEFQEWVKDSKVRLELYQRADIAFDYKAADDLFSNWKLSKGKTKPTSKKDTSKENEDTFKAATLETGSAEGSRTEKVFSRAALIELQLRDPAKYQALQPEIMRAYQEGRVK